MLVLFGVAVLVGVIVAYLGRHILGGMVGLYRVVPPNEAHVRVMGSQKEIFSHRSGGRSAYWIVPFITKVSRLPLSNLTVPINDIKLNDKNMAKFSCDLVCFINIQDVALAAERLVSSRHEEGIGFDLSRLAEDFKIIMESVGRTVVTKQTILEIYMDREALSHAISAEVKGVFPKWGCELVNLELKGLNDTEDSTIIEDIEAKVAAEIKRDAEIKVAQTKREAEVVKAQEEETYRKRQIEKEQAIALAEQDKAEKVAQRQALVNQQLVEAERKKQMGMIEIERDVIEQKALAEKQRQTLEAEGQAKAQVELANAEATANKVKGQAAADVVAQTGKAEAVVIQQKKEADAAGTMKQAEAMQKFNDAATQIKIIDTQRDIMIAKFQAFGNALAKADIKVIQSGAKAGTLFGLDLNAETGANLDQFLDELQVTEEVREKLVEHFRSEGNGKRK